MLNALPGGFALNGIYSVIRGLYQVAGDINEWVDDHIEQMKGSDNLTHARTGRVLEGAKYGFGMGYIAPVVVISLGQFLCGFTKDSLLTVGSAAIGSNPIAMTCAALGAVYYGWNALSEQEKSDTIERLRKDLNVGAELVKSIANFVILKTKELLSSESLQELKDFITKSAQSFGKTLGDVTHAFTDITRDALVKTKDVVETNAEKVKERAEVTYNKMKESSGKLMDSVSQTTENLVEKSKEILRYKNDAIADDNTKSSLSEKLEEIKKLFESGLLSEEIYLEKQREILDLGL